MVEMEKRDLPSQKDKENANCTQYAFSPASSFWTQIFTDRTNALIATRHFSSGSTANIRVWEEEIASLRNILNTANRQRNAHSRTCSFPPELLCRVFEELVVISPMDAHAPNPIARRGWLAVIHVCKHWRNVARANSSLWQRVTVASAPLMDLFVESSRGRPLIVSGCISANKKLSDDLIDLVPAHLHRMKELCLTGQAETAAQELIVQSVFIKFMGALCSIGGPLHEMEVLSLIPSVNIGNVLSPDFFESCAVRLRRMILQGMPLVLRAPLPSLTSLELHGTNAITLIDALKNLPSLEDLTLSSTYFLETLHATQSTLPLVRRLVIENNIAFCARLLDSITIHPLAYIEVGVTRAGRHDEDMLRILGHALLSKRYKPTNLELVVGRTDCNILASSGEDAAGSYGPFGLERATPAYPHPWPGLKLTLPLSTSSPDSPCAVAPIIMDHCLSRAFKASWKTVSLRGHIHWIISLILSTFAGANSVDTLIVDTVSRDSVLAVCRALVAQQPDVESRLFPELAALHLASIDLGCPADECDGEDSVVHPLIDVIIDRCEIEKPLNCLTLEDCSIAEGYVDEWYAWIPTLDWDGKTGHAHDCHTDSEGDEDEEDED